MRRNRWPYAALVALLGLSGCAFWDEVTTRTMPRSYRLPKDPLAVLRDSDNGDQRARALQALQEPKAHGKSDQEQEVVIKVLTTSATRDPQPLCRLSAIQTLGGFQDPRAVEALKNAYYQATAFPAETATVVQVAALEALGRTRRAEALGLLGMVAREPAPALTVSAAEKRQAADRKIAAARALANFPQAEAAQTLVQILREEKDVALRHAAHEALQAATGRQLPADAQAWENYLAGGAPPPPKPSLINLASWWK